jgi:hypothetical protein
MVRGELVLRCWGAVAARQRRAPRAATCVRGPRLQCGPRQLSETLLPPYTLRREAKKPLDVTKVGRTSNAHHNIRLDTSGHCFTAAAVQPAVGALKRPAQRPLFPHCGCNRFLLRRPALGRCASRSWPRHCATPTPTRWMALTPRVRRQCQSGGGGAWGDSVRVGKRRRNRSSVRRQ